MLNQTKSLTGQGLLENDKFLNLQVLPSKAYIDSVFNFCLTDTVEPDLCLKKII
jgi:hypothetical protein